MPVPPLSWARSATLALAILCAHRAEAQGNRKPIIIKGVENSTLTFVPFGDSVRIVTGGTGVANKKLPVISFTFSRADVATFVARLQHMSATGAKEKCEAEEVEGHASVSLPANATEDGVFFRCMEASTDSNEYERGFTVKKEPEASWISLNFAGFKRAAASLAPLSRR
jgi:hypothetical protein